MATTDEMLAWRGRKALDRDGSKLGSLEEIYLDTDSGKPEWAAVKTGMFGSKLSFVPLEGAREQGSDIVLDWPESVVKDAPRVDADGELSPEEEDRLYDHYERFDSPEYHGAGREGTAGERETETAGAGTGPGASDRGEHDREGVTAGEAAAGGAGLASGAGMVGAHHRDDETGARSEHGMTAGRDETVAGDTPTRGAPTTPVGGTGDEGTPAGAGAGTEGAGRMGAGEDAGRPPRIKRYVTEELGPDGTPVRRETRTEEIFE